MELYYENHEGVKINLMDFPVAVQDPEGLAQTSWSYTAITGTSARARIKSFYRDMEEHSVTASVFADSPEEYEAIMQEIHQAFERDIRAKKPGRLFWNGYYRECYAIATGYSDYVEDFESVEENITFLSEYPYWIHEKKMEFRVAAASAGSENLDFPYDFNYDLGDPESITAAESESMFECDFELTIYGACTDPSLEINNHVYEVECTLSASERLVIDSAKKKIYKIDRFGAETNMFKGRNRDSYIFQKIGTGEFRIEWAKDFDFDLKLYEERNTPKWN